STLFPYTTLFRSIEAGLGLDNQGSERALVPSDTHIHMPQGFEPGWIYELVYTGKDPLVLGLAHVAVRDFSAFLKYGERDAAGNANPLPDGRTGRLKRYASGGLPPRSFTPDFPHPRLRAAAHRH